MKGALRRALAGNNPLAANPSDGEVLGFVAQLFTDATGAAALSTAQQSAMAAASRCILTTNSTLAANPSDADVVTFWGQINTEALGATVLAPQRYAALRTVLRDALSINYPGASNPSEANVLGYFGSFYSLLADPQLLSFFEPETGIVDQATHGAYGNLTTIGGAIPISGSFDGLPAYRIAAKSGTTGYYKTATNTLQLQMPMHVFFIARSIGSPASGDGLLSSGSNFGAGAIRYNAPSQMTMYGGGSLNMAATTASWNLYECYFHSNKSWYSVNGGAWVTGDITVNGALTGLVLGNMTNGSAPSDCDVLGAYMLEGQPSEAYRASMLARLKARLPTTLTLPAALPAFPDLTLAAPGVFNASNPWDAAICIFSQSNFSNYATDNVSAAWGANSFILRNDNTWAAGGNPATGFQWDSGNQQTDVVGVDTAAGANGSLAGALINAMAAASGRPTVGVPNALGASAVVAGVGSNQDHYWGREAQRGNHQRNSLYWSSVFRAKQVLAWGGTIRRLVVYQGESEANSADAVARAAWPATMHGLIRQWCADVGIPNPYDNLGITTCKTVIVRVAGNASPTWTDFRTNVVPTIPLNANQVMVDAPVAGPFEGDGIHLRSAPLDTLGALIAAA